MKDIKRYEIERVCSECRLIEEDNENTGEWVKHEDHSAIVAALQDQVRAMAAENLAMRNAINHTIGWQESVDPSNVESVSMLVGLVNLKPDVAIREIRAQAVDAFGIYHNFSEKQSIQAEAKKYAARIRAGEVL